MLALALWTGLLGPATAPQAPPAPVAPQAPASDGTVIKPTGPVDPGIQAKTPPAARFPTPVIKPASPPR